MLDRCHTLYFPHQNQRWGFTVQRKQRSLLPPSLHCLTAVIDLLCQAPLSQTAKAVLTLYIGVPWCGSAVLLGTGSWGVPVTVADLGCNSSKEPRTYRVHQNTARQQCWYIKIFVDNLDAWSLIYSCIKISQQNCFTPELFVSRTGYFGHKAVPPCVYLGHTPLLSAGVSPP